MPPSWALSMPWLYYSRAPPVEELETNGYFLMYLGKLLLKFWTNYLPTVKVRGWWAKMGPEQSSNSRVSGILRPQGPSRTLMSDPRPLGRVPQNYFVESIFFRKV